MRYLLDSDYLVALYKPDDASHARSSEIFLKQTKKGYSFVDCANLALIEAHKFDGILSFDKFYPKDLRKG